MERKWKTTISLCSCVIITITISVATAQHNGGGSIADAGHYLRNAIRDLNVRRQQSSSVMHAAAPYSSYGYAPSRRRNAQVIGTAPGGDQLSRVTVVTTTPQTIVTLRPTNTLSEGGSLVAASTEKSGVRRVYSSGADSSPSAPQLQLTRGELAAIYRAALHRGQTVQLTGTSGGGSDDKVNAVLHEIGDDGGERDSASSGGAHAPGEDAADGAASPDAGYYYYYYPLKSFDDGGGSGSHSHEVGENSNHENADSIKSQSVDNPYVHSHMHKHSVHIEPMYHHMEPETISADKKLSTGPSRALEPLFMAISGFVGMTLMFILSILVLPRIGILKSGRRRNTTPKDGDAAYHDEDALSESMNVVYAALEGADCSERFVCEAGKAANALHLYDNRFVKFVKRVGPIAMRRQLNKIGKYTDKKYRCAAIQCKRKDGTAIITSKVKNR